MTLPLMLVAAFTAIAIVPPTPWEMLPHPTAYRMANTARAVVEGELGDGGVVTVTKRYYVRAGDKIGATIVVPTLVDMSRTVEHFEGMGGETVDSATVLLFLRDNPKGNEWVPLHLCGNAARGVLRFEDDNVYGYAQSMNPGGYVLGRWHFGWGKDRVPASPDEVRTLVSDGVVARIKWRDTLRIRDREKRAAAVAEWFSPKTSPDGKWWRERIWPDLSRASDDLGELMVRPLGRIVQAEDDKDAAVAAADALARLGARARPATPALIARLRDPRSVEPIFLLRALHRLADPRAADVLRDFVPHRDAFVAAEAAIALHVSGGDDALELLVARMPKGTDAEHPVPAIASLLESLHEIDQATAERIVRERYRHIDQLMMQRAWLRRLR